ERRHLRRALRLGPLRNRVGTLRFVGGCRGGAVPEEVRVLLVARREAPSDDGNALVRELLRRDVDPEAAGDDPEDLPVIGEAQVLVLRARRVTGIVLDDQLDLASVDAAVLVRDVDACLGAVDEGRELRAERARRW